MMTRVLAVALLGSVVLACGATADEGTPPKPVRLDDCRTSYDMPFGFANSLGIFLT